MNRRYEIKPTPKISDWSASFSPDGKYLALITAKGAYGPHGKGIFVQLYSADTGTKLAEFPERNAPSNWFNGNQILLFNYGTKMKALEFGYGQAVVCPRYRSSPWLYKSCWLCRLHRKEICGVYTSKHSL
jgi:hypothetical protein